MSVADKLHQRQMALRKKSGLPHPDYYKELGHSYNISDDNERLAKQAEIKKKYKVEEVEQLDEMPESSMKTRDVHAHLKKSGWSLARSSGGHDVYKHPKAKHSIPVPRHNQLKAPLIRGIMKASRVSEETEIDEQLHKKGKFVSGPVKKPYKSPTVVTPIREAKDAREYDYEGDMAMSQLRSLVFNAEDLIELMDENTNLPEWVQSKITLAEDYISTAANYLRGELTEAANPAQQAAIAINMKKKGIKPKSMKEEVKDEYARKIDKYLKKKYNKEEVEIDEAAKWRSTSVAKKVTDPDDESSRSYDYHHENPRSTGMKQATSDKPYSYGSLMARPESQVASQGARKGMITKQHAARLKDRIKSAMRKEEVELSEGRPSQRHPLEGHEYHKKTNAELEYIAKDAHKAAEAMKGHNTTAENKYRDQANDSATVRYFRKKSGMPDWYKKKYGHVKEEVEQLDEVGDTKKGQKLLRMVNKRAVDRLVSKRADKDPAYAKKAQQTHLAADERLKEEVEYLEEKNEPTNPALWSKAKSLARSKFDVYPSAYANGWAAKWYKSKGGGWKTVSEDVDEPSAAARTLSRKAQIVRDAAKGKKQEQEEASDKFQKDPELSSDMQKT